MLKNGRGPEDLIPRIMAAAEVGAMASGKVLEGKIVTLLSQPGHGRWYKSRKGMGLHRASSPGEPPATDTNKLRGSIRTVNNSSGRRIRVRVGTDTKYAPFLEYGRRGMAPRPFMRPAFGLARSRMKRIMRAQLRRAV